jgi:hypothetical protein
MTEVHTHGAKFGPRVAVDVFQSGGGRRGMWHGGSCPAQSMAVSGWLVCFNCSVCHAFGVFVP